jgi:hypothetical protein
MLPRRSRRLQNMDPGGQVPPSKNLVVAADAPNVAAWAPLLRRGSPNSAPLVLQVSPLPGSPDSDNFFYEPFADVERGDFAAARAFFIHHGHTVVYHECPDTAAFQALYPTAVIAYLSSLPEGLIAKGHNLLPTRRLAINLAPMLVTPP